MVALAVEGAIEGMRTTLPRPCREMQFAGALADLQLEGWPTAFTQCVAVVGPGRQELRVVLIRTQSDILRWVVSPGKKYGW